MTEEGLEFRATKDIDLVLIVEAITPAFGKLFWEFVIAAGYEYRNKSTGAPHFYRFSAPSNSEFPYMIELFTRKAEGIVLPEEAVLTPLPMDDDVSSLSAILLDDDYYRLLQQGTTIVDGVSVLDAAYLIPFKAKAWLDLTVRKDREEAIDSKNIRKHKNDVFRLSVLLPQDLRVSLSATIWEDMQAFITAMNEESVDTKQLGITRSKNDVLAILSEVYVAP